MEMRIFSLGKFTLLLCCYVFFSGCKKAGDITPHNTDTLVVSVPVVVADSISGLISSAVSFYGNITAGNPITDRGVYWSKSPVPTDNKTTATSYVTNGTFSVEVSNLEPNTTYYIRGYAENSKGTSYSKVIQFTTPKVSLSHPQIVTDTLFASGAYTAFVAGKALNDKNEAFKETGICISENSAPAVTDRKMMSPGTNDVNIFIRIDSLKEATQYHIRVYAIDIHDNEYYGDDIRISTIVRGQMTYTLVNEDMNADADTKAAYQRIKAAFNSAVEYSNNFTSIVKHVSVNYSPGTPTADASISGWINFGANPAYQQTGTALHEIAHAVGVGTSWFWPQLIVNGICQGSNTNKMLQFMTHDPAATVHGDAQHFWPFGINGSWEDTGNDIDYIIHNMILQGMKKDGLPSE